MGENSGNLRSPHVVISEGRPGTGLPTATGLVDQEHKMVPLTRLLTGHISGFLERRRSNTFYIVDPRALTFQDVGQAGDLIKVVSG